MECDLCKQEPSVSGSLLCATCAEAIRRLLTIQRETSGSGATSSDSLQSGSHNTRTVGLRDM